MEYHTWEEKDNLLLVTNKYKVTEEKLKRLNAYIVDWNCIEAGTKIKVK